MQTLKINAKDWAKLNKYCAQIQEQYYMGSRETCQNRAMMFCSILSKYANGKVGFKIGSRKWLVEGLDKCSSPTMEHLNKVMLKDPKSGAKVRLCNQSPNYFYELLMAMK